MELEFIERRQCVHFLGAGHGEVAARIALGFETVKAGKSVFLATLAESVYASG